MSSFFPTNRKQQNFRFPSTGSTYKDGPENIFFAKVDGPENFGRLIG